MNDTILGQRFITGGEAELEEIIDRYSEKLLRYATAILCDYQDAENVVQDVFLIAYQNRSSFDGLNLPGWLYKITYHRSINQLKKRKSLWQWEISFDQLAKEPLSPAPSESSLGSETLIALSKLKPKERALLYARIMEGQSYNEIAYSTGSSPAALTLFLILGSTVTAAKLGSFGWLMETINPRYREIVEPVEAFSEDNDIRLEIIGAQKYENTAVVYLSLQDISGQKRLTEKSDFSDTLNVATTFPKKTSSLKEEVSSSISVGKKLLFFDAENNKLYYEFYISADGYSPLTDNLQISAKVINFDYQPYEGEIPLQSLKLEENAPIRIDGKHIISAAWSNEDPGNELWALPLGNPERLTDERGDLKLSNIGIIDGQLHLQTLSPFQGEFGSKFHSFDLIDPQGNKIEEEYSFSFVSDNQGTLIHLSKDNFDNAINRYNEYVFPIEPNEASSYTIRYSFDVITGTEGEWKVAANLTDRSLFLPDMAAHMTIAFIITGNLIK